ncbi:MAG: hypothetical protein IPK19_16445 [Chloroflexi bacterium]|nr:hypothetical protein [Chloroflexota bacterium]
MRGLRNLFLLVVSLFVAAVAPLIGRDNVNAVTLKIDQAEVATQWFDLQLTLVRTTPGFSPPVASRVLAYTGIVLYESIVPGMPEYQSLAGQLNGLDPLPQPSSGSDYHWAAVANSALATLIRRLYVHTADENKAAIEALYERFADEFAATLDPDVLARSGNAGPGRGGRDLHLVPDRWRPRRGDQ